MTVITIKAYAKINLALDILGKRPDGYHEMNMVMQSVDWYDEVDIRRCSRGIQLVIDRDDLPADESNLAYRAAQALREACALSDGVYITLHKKIPLAAGMAGGSSDAAAVLIGMNELLELGLPLAKLETIAAGVGSDVAFCLRGGTQLATGRGEIMTPLPDLPDCWVVLAKLPLSVSTAWVFQHYLPDLVAGHPDVSRMIMALHERNLAAVAGYGGNVLETVTLAAYPEVAALKQIMLTFDPLLCLMSGSGPTVFALMTEQEKALQMVQTLKKQEGLFVAMVKNVAGRKL